MRVVRRNEFVDTQVVVEPVDPDHLYLPDLRDRFEQRDDVASAWLSTKSRYTQGMTSSMYFTGRHGEQLGLTLVTEAQVPKSLARIRRRRRAERARRPRREVPSRR